MKELLGDPDTTFLLVTSPEREPVEEAIFFHGRLRMRGMPFGGIIVNRVHRAPETDAEVARAELARRARGASSPARSPTRCATSRCSRAATRRAVERVKRELGVEDPVLVPLLDQDVYDLEG